MIKCHIYIKLIRTDLVYKEWIQDVSRRFRRSQLKAAVKVNDEMLRFYWSLGQDISRMNKDARYGTEFYKTISRDLKDIFPDVHSFSPTNLKYMRYFYEMYPDVTNRQQLVDDFKTAENRQQAADDLGKEIIFYIPWGHHMVLLDKMKGNPEKAMFYIRKTLENNWSRTVLLNFVDTNLYERQGKAVTNFAQTLPAPQSELAQDITRDPYNFDFLTIREKYDEKELKNALMDKVENFLMELGTGFAFMGREVRLEVGNKEKYVVMNRSM